MWHPGCVAIILSPSSRTSLSLIHPLGVSEFLNWISTSVDVYKSVAFGEKTRPARPHDRPYYINDGRDYYSNFKHYNQGPGERVASWADPVSRVEINFHFYGAFRRMLLPPSMLLICKICFIMDLF